MTIFRRKHRPETLELGELSHSRTLLELFTHKRGSRELTVSFTIDEIEDILLDADLRKARDAKGDRK